MNILKLNVYIWRGKKADFYGECNVEGSELK